MSSSNVNPWVIKTANKKSKKLRISISASSGSGKAQPLYSKVLTKNGFVEMKDIKIGMDVFTDNGELSKVVNIYPQGTKRVWEFTLSDGSKVQSCEEHLWKTSTIYERTRKKESIKTSLQIVNSLKVSEKANHFIDLCKPIQFSKKEFIIHPYIMGVLLGDGSFRSDSLVFTSADEEIADNVNKLLPIGLQLKKRGINYTISRELIDESNNINLYVEELKYLNLNNAGSFDKFIPQEYLHSSIDDRIELLQGLIDTDGSIYSQGGVEYTTTSCQLKDDVKFLVESLGGYCSRIQERTTRYIYKQEIKQGKLSYRMKIILPNEITPCKLKRKLDRATKYTKYFPVRNIVEANYIGEVECQCIEIDSPSHLYITDNFIVTHNTYGALKIAYGITGDWGKILLIDSENDSASIYSDLGPFKVIVFEKPYSPQRYIQVIKYAESQGFEVIIIDSISHEWDGKGGALEQHAKLGGRFQDWAVITPLHNDFIEAVISCKAHTICTIRRKEGFTLNQGASGKMQVEKMGLEEQQRSGFSYEMDIVFEVQNSNHFCKTTKDRTRLFTDEEEFIITEETGKRLAEWAANGVSQLDEAMEQLRGATSLAELTSVWTTYASLQGDADFKASTLAKRDYLKQVNTSESASTTENENN